MNIYFTHLEKTDIADPLAVEKIPKLKKNTSVR